MHLVSVLVLVQLHLLLLLLLLLPSSPQRSVSPLEAVEHATNLFNSGSPEEALELLHRVTVSAPQLPEAHFFLGAVYQHQEDFFAAKRHYEKCFELDPGHADSLNNLGKLYSDHGFEDLAVESYSLSAAADPSHLQSRINLGLSHHSRGRFAAAVATYTAALPLNPSSDSLHYNLAVSLSHLGTVEPAVEHYRLAIQARFGRIAKGEAGADYSEAWLNLAAMHHKHGTLADAVWHYNRTAEAILGGEGGWRGVREAMGRESGGKGGGGEGEGKLEEEGTEGGVWGPLAADSFVFEMLLMVLNNMGQALSQMGRVVESNFHHSSAARILEARLEQLREGGGSGGGGVEERREVMDNLLHTKAHLFRSAKMSCSWSDWPNFDVLLRAVRTEQMSAGLQSALLPFDTLGLPVTPAWRKEVAVAHARHLTEWGREVEEPTPVSPESGRGGERRRLKIGYICYDFNDHPTAHLAEGLFLYHNRSGRVDVDAYNYGKDDNSTYRRNIEDLVGGKEVDGGRFLELSGDGHDEAALRVRSAAPHVLIDMQGFTLGGRPEISARKVAPIQVNYLIFPGTSGAGFNHYIVGDQWVTPPEHQSHFVEKLAMMPNSYQINYYDRHLEKGGEVQKDEVMAVEGVGQRKGYRGFGYDVRGSDEWKALRTDSGLSADPSVFVFANFNKQDKLEPTIYSSWMQALSRTPGSVLWLLEPSHKFKGSGVVEHLREEAAARGIARERIVFAKRVSKAEHLKRVAAADLFLDSFMYGAHSTATDALRGGLPVLTVGGGSFARRVGISLVENLGEGLEDILLLATGKELVDVSVWLAGTVEGGERLRDVGERLRRTWSGKLFDTELYTRDFERLSMGMWEIKQSCREAQSCSEDNEYMHLVLT